MSDNGFEDMANKLLKMSNINQEVALESLQEAADYYLARAMPNIPQSLAGKDHMRHHVKVVLEDGMVKIVFDKTKYYWRFAENGTGGEHGQRAQNFMRGAYEQNRAAIEKIMTQKILDKLK